VSAASRRTADVVIIGAGILGVVTAWRLATLRAGRIWLLEARMPGAGATGRSGALIRSNYDDETEARLAQASIGFFRNFAEVVGGACGWRQTGLLVVDSGSAGPPGDRVARQRDWGVDISVIDPTVCAELAPGVRVDDAVGLAWQASGGHCDPIATLRSLMSAAVCAGVQLRMDARATAIGNDHVVLDSGEVIPAGIIVVASGQSSNELLATVGLDYGLTPRWSPIGFFRTMRSGDVAPPIIVDELQSAWFKPDGDDGVLVGADRCGVLAPTTAQVLDLPSQDRVEIFRQVLSHRFPKRDATGFSGARAGVYVMSPDGRPLVGAVERRPGLFLAVGDSGGAFKIAPALGEALAQTIVSQRSEIDIASLSPDRLLPPSSAG